MKPTIRLVACLVTLLLTVAMWLTFAYLMKDTGMIGAILGLGLLAVLLIGNWVTDLAVEPLRPSASLRSRRRVRSDGRGRQPPRHHRSRHGVGGRPPMLTGGTA